MNFFFCILSVAYIAGIFLFADSPIVSDVATFNPYSLLHIPLYGILTLLLIFSFSCRRKKFLNPQNLTNPISSRTFFIASLIALVIAVADEIHQAYIPSREASITDVFLDIVGIVFCVLMIKRIKKIFWFLKAMYFFR
jgi:VanZ family protein